MKFNQKEYLINIANETIDIINRGFYINKNRTKVQVGELVSASVNGTELIKEYACTSANKDGKGIDNIAVISGSTIDTIIDLRKQGIEGNIVALNFASAKHAGGGFLRGTIAQEESIARTSALYPSLMSKKEFYDYNVNLNTPLYSDLMIYSPEVPIFRDDKFNLLLNPVTSSIITSPAVNAGIARERGIKENVIRDTMAERIDKIVDFAVSKEPEVILLGAYGCGVFKNDITMVANLFKQSLSKIKTDKDIKVIFAIYDKDGKMVDIFNKILCK